MDSQKHEWDSGGVCNHCGLTIGSPEHCKLVDQNPAHRDYCAIKPVGANARQVAGKHYKIPGEQHWDRIWRLYGRGYFVGCATKYLERYHLKNGVEDLEKARHYVDKLIELETAAQPEEGGKSQ